MPERVTVEFLTEPPLATVIAGFFTTRERMEQLVEPTREIARVMMDDIEQNFAVEGRPNPWEPLAESTVRKRGSSHPILDDSGDLRDEATDESSWTITSGGNQAEAHLDAAQIPYYGFFHVTGVGDFMPARDWTFISDDALDRADEIVREFMDNALEAIPG